MADNDHIAQLKKGVAAWNVWRDANPNRPDLSMAWLYQADLSKVNLSEAGMFSIIWGVRLGVSFGGISVVPDTVSLSSFGLLPECQAAWQKNDANLDSPNASAIDEVERDQNDLIDLIR
jgi:hypothetical protein